MSEITVDLPEHVIAALGDEQTAADYMTATATAEARSRAVAVAYDEAQQAMSEVAALFDGTSVPDVKTVPERVQTVESDQVALRAQVRTIGVALAIAAGVAEQDAVGMIDAALAAQD